MVSKGNEYLAGSSVLLLIVAIFPIVLIAGCLDNGGTEELDLIVVSIAPQKQMIERIVGDDIEVVLMVPENMDPHSYTLTPSQLLKVSKADMYFKIGSGVEFEEVNMKNIEETNSEMVIVDLSEGIDVLSFDEHGITHDHGDEEEDPHDEHGTDPHIWLAPDNMKKMAENALNALIEKDLERKDLFTTNFGSYISDLDELNGSISDLLSPYSDEEFLTYHPAWGYYADAFDLIQLAVEEGGKDPGPQGVASLIDQAREHNITVVFVEPQFDSSSAQQIADEIGGEVIVVDPLAFDYLENMLIVAQKMENGFNDRS